MGFLKNFIPGFLIKQYRNYKKQKALKPYKGNKVFCPICNSSFNNFAPHGLPIRENARCWNCGSLERHRLLYKYFNDKTNLFTEGSKIRLLHFAPEKAFYDIFSQKKNIDYVPCDLSPERYNYNGKVKVWEADITKIPFEDNSFDVVICNRVLEHVPNDIQAMKEMYRVMKNGGWGILSAPIDYTRENTYEDFTITTASGREKAFGQHDHVRWYGRDYKDKLKHAGFKVTEDDYVKKFSADELFRFGLQDKEIIYYCEK